MNKCFLLDLQILYLVMLSWMVQISCTNYFSYNFSDISEKLILMCDPRYVLYTAFTLTTAITEWSSLLYTVLYTSLPTIVVGILDKDLNKATLIAYPKLYGSGQRDDKYNVNLFVLNMLEALWQSLVVFYLPYFAYRRSTIDMSSLGDLWALAPVIVVNMQLAMDIIRWNWIIHAFVWGTIAATTVCLFVIDSIWVLPGYGWVLSLQPLMTEVMHFPFIFHELTAPWCKKSKMNSGPSLCKIMFLECKMIRSLNVSGKFAWRTKPNQCSLKKKERKTVLLITELRVDYNLCLACKNYDLLLLHCGFSNTLRTSITKT